MAVTIRPHDTAADLEVTLGHLAEAAARIPDEGPRRAAHPASAKSRAHADINKALDAWQTRTALEATGLDLAARFTPPPRRTKPRGVDA